MRDSRPTSAERQASLTGDDPALAKYLKYVRTRPRLSAEEEHVAAVRFEEAELGLWSALVGWLPTAAQVAHGFVGIVVSDKRQGTGRLVEALLDFAAFAERARATGSRAFVCDLAPMFRAKWTAAEREAGVLIRRTDIDRRWTRTSIAGVEALAAIDTVMRGSGAESDRWIGMVHAADRAQKRKKQVLIEALLPLVVDVAKHHGGRHFSLLDAVQDGNMGLMQAIEKFDAHRGLRLSTSAWSWIRASIGDGHTSSAVRVPRHTKALWYRVQVAAEAFTRREGRGPSDDELAAEANVKPSLLAQLRRPFLRKQLEAPAPTHDYNDESEGHNSLAMGDDLFLLEGGAEQLPNAEDKLEAQDRKAMTTSLIDTLTEEQRQVIHLCLDERELSPAEAAAELGMHVKKFERLKTVAVAQLGKAAKRIKRIG